MLKNRTAIITGGSRGLGLAIARKFVSQGATLVLVAMDEGRLKSVTNDLSSLGAEVRYIAGDIARPEFASKVAKSTIDDFGKIDILVNCAGVITRTPFEELSLEDWYRVIDVNLHGTFHMCRSVMPVMREAQYGKVINMTSQMARLPHPGASPSYEVSKAGQTALTRHLAYQYAKNGICVNAIAPGSIDTEMPKNMSPDAREKIKSGIPMHRLGEPEEVADCALFLASSMSDYITGATIDINGGSLMS